MMGQPGWLSRSTKRFHARQPPGMTLGTSRSMPGRSASWESALTEANKRAEAALALADRADARADRAEARAEAAEHAAKQAQGEALATAQAAEAVHRADAARKARGLLARLRAAVRGGRDGGGG